MIARRARCWSGRRAPEQRLTRNVVQGPLPSSPPRVTGLLPSLPVAVGRPSPAGTPQGGREPVRTSQVRGRDAVWEVGAGRLTLKPPICDPSPSEPGYNRRAQVTQAGGCSWSSEPASEPLPGASSLHSPQIHKQTSAEGNTWGGFRN